jgi:hypothetical protein
MKSRSVIKLLHQVDEWYVQCARATALPAGEWQTSGNGTFTYTEEDSQTARSAGRLGGRPAVWTISEIVSNRALLAEGAALKHCVVSYARRCARGDISIWSLQVNRFGQPRHVLTIAVDNNKAEITQTRGRFNAHQDSELASAAIAPDDGSRPHGRLNHTDRDFLLRAYRVMRFWARKEGLTYRENG